MLCLIILKSLILIFRDLTIKLLNNSWTSGNLMVLLGQKTPLFSGLNLFGLRNLTAWRLFDDLGKPLLPVLLLRILLRRCRFV
ncbi:hypothetical protein TorRG33x02_077070 [Trema orientale]|uniref:LRR domain containing protein n=1 Tax=Trema orientale TaxID=63057 RepID=A0A2P5FF92_TREOI|nr:hypothetical protein TorRG33x02_077070 [Trema orientale]